MRERNTSHSRVNIQLELSLNHNRDYINTGNDYNIIDLILPPTEAILWVGGMAEGGHECEPILIDRSHLPYRAFTISFVS